MVEYRFEFEKQPIDFQEIDIGIRRLVSKMQDSRLVSSASSCEGHPGGLTELGSGRLGAFAGTPEWGHISFNVAAESAVDAVRSAYQLTQSLEDKHPELLVCLTVYCEALSSNPRKGERFTAAPVDITPVVRKVEQRLGLSGDDICYHVHIPDPNLFDTEKDASLESKCFTGDFYKGYLTSICGYYRPKHVLQTLSTGENGRRLTAEDELLPLLKADSIETILISQIGLSYEPRASEYDALEMKMAYREIITHLEELCDSF